MKENLKILLAGTDMQQLLSLSEKLEEAYENALIVSAYNVEEIKNILTGCRVDLVVLSYESSGLCVEDVLHMVSQRFSNTPLVIMCDTIDEVPREAFAYKRCSMVSKNNYRHLEYVIERELTESQSYDKYMSLLGKYQSLGITSKTQSKDYLTIFNAAPVGMILLDEKLVIKKVNTEVGKIFNRNLSELLNKKIGNAIGCVTSTDNGMGCGYGTGCQFCHITNIVNKALKDEEAIYDIEIQQQCMATNMTSKYYWLNMSVIPIYIQSRVYIVIVLDDVTDYLNIEQKLIRSRDFYLTLFEEFPALIWRSDLEGKRNYFNKTWLNFTGRSREQEIGDGWRQRVHPEDLDRCLKAYNESITSRQSFELEYRLQRCDGEYRWILSIGRPYFDIDGSIAGYIGVGYDITERRAAEEGLKRYQILSNKARDIILFMDTDGRIIEANEAAAAAYGYSREELLQKTVYDIRRDDENARMQIYQAESEGIFFETLHYRKDGLCFPVEVSSQATEIKGRKVILSIIRDTTERVRFERELKKAKEDAEMASKAKSEFLANMSHEIRTPLNGVIGMIDLTLLTELTQKQRENIGIAKNCANTLLNVINDVLDFSKIEAGKMTIEAIEYDIRQVTERIAKAHSALAEKKGLKLQYSVDEGIPAILCGDPGKLGQIINNLLSNAIKFTESGEIALRIRKVNNSFPMAIQFSISDTGIGMTAEEMDRLFRSFSQVDGSITRKYGGTGLGLSISKMLAEMMGGKIWVESRKGSGSTFSFTAVFESGAGGAVAEENVHKLEIQKAIKALNILLVEDDRINQIITRQMLVEKGHHIEVANNGMEGLSMASGKKYDVILMDIQMPLMDGMEAAKFIREYEATRNQYTPIIALTAYAFRDDKQKFIAAGMDDYISKPVQMNEMFNKIEEVSRNCNDRVYGSEKDKDLHPSENMVDLIPETESFGIDMKSKYALLREALDVKNVIMAESIANSIKNIASECNETEIKNIAFKLILAIRRRSLEEAENYGKELEIKIAN